ncbi:MAG: Uncharacterised protein [Synechococcus sp. MIT S9220]|nr:MAG: Uncharacterised protein [Synechococcus sp. MIT S9220]
MDACTHVLGSTDNLQSLLSTHIHLADTEFVGIGMPLAGHDFTDHNTLSQQREIFQLLHFKSSHRQAFTQLISGLIHLHQILQPGERNPHWELEVSA